MYTGAHNEKNMGGKGARSTYTLKLNIPTYPCCTRYQKLQRKQSDVPINSLTIFYNTRCERNGREACGSRSHHRWTSWTLFVPWELSLPTQVAHGHRRHAECDHNGVNYTFRVINTRSTYRSVPGKHPRALYHKPPISLDWVLTMHKNSNRAGQGLWACH